MDKNKSSKNISLPFLPPFRVGLSGIDNHQANLLAAIITPESIDMTSLGFRLLTSIEPHFFYGKYKRIFESCKKTYDSIGNCSLDSLFEYATIEDREDCLEFSKILVKPESVEKSVNYLENFFNKKRVMDIIHNQDLNKLSYDQIFELFVNEKTRIECESFEEKYSSSRGVTSAIEYIEELSSNKRDIKGISSGYKFFDESIGGHCKGELNCWAALPAIGKTAIAVSMIKRLITSGHKAMLISQELNERQICLRFIFAISEARKDNIVKGVLTENDLSNIAYASNLLSEKKLFIYTPKGKLYIEDIEKAVFAGHKQVPVFFIDYFQLIYIRDKRCDSRRSELSEISQRIQALVKDLNVCIHVLAQMAKASEKESRTYMGSIQDCNDITNDAFNVFYISKPPEDDESDKSELKPRLIINAKSRDSKGWSKKKIIFLNGPTGEFVESVFPNKPIF